MWQTERMTDDARTDWPFLSGVISLCLLLISFLLLVMIKIDRGPYGAGSDITVSLSFAMLFAAGALILSFIAIAHRTRLSVCALLANLIGFPLLVYMLFAIGNALRYSF